MIKVEVTHQEETFQEELSREEMAALIDEALTQKINKTIEEQADALMKIGSRLFKLEESKLKKPVHVEIHDEDEREEWDEKDRVDYKRNKQFEKLTADTVAMKEKMEKLQLAFRKGILSNMIGDI